MCETTQKKKRKPNAKTEMKSKSKPEIIVVEGKKLKRKCGTS